MHNVITYSLICFCCCILDIEIFRCFWYRFRTCLTDSTSISTGTNSSALSSESVDTCEHQDVSLALYTMYIFAVFALHCIDKNKANLLYLHLSRNILCTWDPVDDLRSTLIVTTSLDFRVRAADASFPSTSNPGTTSRSSP